MLKILDPNSIVQVLISISKCAQLSNEADFYSRKYFNLRNDLKPVFYVINHVMCHLTYCAFEAD